MQVNKEKIENIKLSWKDWNPGLDNDDMTMREVFSTLPGVGQEEVSWLVRMFENPKSPIAFNGAITLERHDCVHILLGRGLLMQDEAFVIGFTMGTSKKISDRKAKMFEFVAEYLYPKTYKFSENDIKVFELGLQRGKECGVKRIYEFPVEDHIDKTMGELRSFIGINTEKLREVYAEEKELLPDSKASKRLSV